MNGEQGKDVGRVLAGRYELGELLGTGGMAEVYAAVDRLLGRTVAVKVLRPELARDEKTRNWFRREAQSAASLSHPTVVAVHDTGTDGDEPFIVMELVKGHTLRELMPQGRPLPVERALEITEGVLTALEVAHQAGIVHRDIKPGNVMITPDGAVKVMDFGIARALGDDVTITQTFVGTPAYLSPEHAGGIPVDGRSDLYSTGCMLFEMLTGRPPFVADSAYVVAVQHIQDDPPVPSTLNPALPPVLDQIVAKALVKDREARYQTAAQLRDDLAAVRTAGASAVGAGPPTSGTQDDPTDPIVMETTARMPSAVLSAVPAGTGPASVAAGGVSSAPAAYYQGGQGLEGPGASASGPTKRRWPWVAAAAGLVVVVGGALFALLQGGDGGETPLDAESEPVIVDTVDAESLDKPSSADLQESVTELTTVDTVRVLDTHGTVDVLDPVGTVKPWVEPPKTEDDGRTLVTISTDVLFDFGSAEIGEGGLDAIVESVKEAPDGASIDVTGYTDSVGGDETNTALSQQRADAVAEIIRSERPSLEVSAVGKGSADEVEPNTNADGSDNPEGRAKNRRVEIRYDG